MNRWAKISSISLVTALVLSGCEEWYIAKDTSVVKSETIEKPIIELSSENTLIEDWDLEPKIISPDNNISTITKDVNNSTEEVKEEVVVVIEKEPVKKEPIKVEIPAEIIIAPIVITKISPAETNVTKSYSENDKNVTINFDELIANYENSDNIIGFNIEDSIAVTFIDKEIPYYDISIPKVEE